MRRRLNQTYEDKLSIAKSILLGQETRQQIADRLGVHVNTITDWVRRYRRDVIQDLHLSVIALEKENEQLKSLKQTTLDKVFFENGNTFLVDDTGFTQVSHCERLRIS